MVFTKVTARMHNFLSTVAQLTRNKGRVLFYCCHQGSRCNRGKILATGTDRRLVGSGLLETER